MKPFWQPDKRLALITSDSVSTPWQPQICSYYTLNPKSNLVPWVGSRLVGNSVPKLIPSNFVPFFGSRSLRISVPTLILICFHDLGVDYLNLGLLHWLQAIWFHDLGVDYMELGFLHCFQSNLAPWSWSRLLGISVPLLIPGNFLPWCGGTLLGMSVLPLIPSNLVPWFGMEGQESVRGREGQNSRASVLFRMYTYMYMSCVGVMIGMDAHKQQLFSTVQSSNTWSVVTSGMLLSFFVCVFEKEPNRKVMLQLYVHRPPCCAAVRVVLASVRVHHVWYVTRRPQDRLSINVPDSDVFTFAFNEVNIKKSTGWRGGCGCGSCASRSDTSSVRTVSFPARATPAWLNNNAAATNTNPRSSFWENCVRKCAFT